MGHEWFRGICVAKNLKGGDLAAGVGEKNTRDVKIGRMTPSQISWAIVDKWRGCRNHYGFQGKNVVGG